MVRILCLLLMCAAAWPLAVPAAAQTCLLCADGRAPAAAPNERRSDRPLRIDIRADLDFSRLTAGTGGGSVELDPATGSRRLAGNIVDLGGFALVGDVVVDGDPGRMVRVTLPATITLTSDTGGDIVVTDLRTDLPPDARLGADGSLRFRFGGRLTVRGDHEGNYRGRIPISVDYP